jgi:drug/metabolite transporter (DMT)-like permease
MNRYLRMAMVIIAFLQLILGLGFAFRMPFATAFWPFSYTGAMSYIFLGSIATAAAASTFWCIWEREDGALSGIALDYIAIFFALGVFVLQSSQANSRQTWLGIAGILGGIFGVLLFLHTVRIPITPEPPLPRLVRVSFIVFIIALVVVGGQMVLKVPNIIPWDLTPASSVIYGWMFLGAALYFAYTLVRPSWHNAGGQLAGFLAYDLVLLLPFLQRLTTIEPEYQLSQLVYLAVVLYSGALAIYYLFIKPETRLSRVKPPAMSDSSLSPVASQTPH